MPKKPSSCIVPGLCRIRRACLSQRSNYGSSNWYIRDKILLFPHWCNGCLGHVCNVSIRVLPHDIFRGSSCLTSFNHCCADCRRESSVIGCFPCVCSLVFSHRVLQFPPQ